VLRKFSCENGAGAEIDPVLFFYDGWQCVEEYTSAGARTKRYVYGEGIDEVVKATVPDVNDGDSDMNTSEELDLYYHQNSLGSVAAVTDLNGTVVEEYSYTAYGELTVDTRVGTTTGTGTSTRVAQPFGFTGRRHDYEEGSSLLYYRLRYYDPVAGRFVSRDPLGLWGDPAQRGNGQSYCGANPVNFVDPMGLDTYSPWDPRGWLDSIVLFPGAEPAEDSGPGIKGGTGFGVGFSAPGTGGWRTEQDETCLDSEDLQALRDLWVSLEVLKWTVEAYDFARGFMKGAATVGRSVWTRWGRTKVRGPKGTKAGPPVTVGSAADDLGLYADDAWVLNDPSVEPAVLDFIERWLGKAKEIKFSDMPNVFKPEKSVGKTMVGRTARAETKGGVVEFHDEGLNLGTMYREAIRVAQQSSPRFKKLVKELGPEKAREFFDKQADKLMERTGFVKGS